jgi:hypothetical protein
MVIRGGSGGVDRVLKEHRHGLSPEGSAKNGRQTMARIGDQRSSGQRRRPKGCKGWAVSSDEFKPTELASLQNAKGAGEGMPKLWPNKLVVAGASSRSLGMGWPGWKTKHGGAMGGEQMRASTNGLAKLEEKTGSAATLTAAIRRGNR